MNGDEINVRRGDKLVTLEERLSAQDREISWLRRLVFLVLVILLVHAVAPQLDLFDTLLRLIGA